MVIDVALQPTSPLGNPQLTETLFLKTVYGPGSVNKEREDKLDLDAVSLARYAQLNTFKAANIQHLNYMNKWPSCEALDHNWDEIASTSHNLSVSTALLKETITVKGQTSS